MPFSTRYVIQQLARGRPVPGGSPEYLLHQALGRMSSMEMEDAIGKGARCDVPDSRGRSSGHILLDHAFLPSGELSVDPRRLVACLRVLARHSAHWEARHPVTRTSVVERLIPLASHPVGPEIRALLARQLRWSTRVAGTEQTLAQAWDEASPLLASPPRRSPR